MAKAVEMAIDALHCQSVGACSQPATWLAQVVANQSKIISTNSDNAYLARYTSVAIMPLALAAIRSLEV